MCITVDPQGFHPRPIGLLSLIGQFLLVRRGRFLTAPARLVTWGLVIGLLGLPLVQVLTVLFYEDTLSGGGGMERALAEKFPQLINGHLKRRLKAPLQLEESSSPAQRLRRLR